MTSNKAYFEGKGGMVNYHRLTEESQNRLFEALPPRLQNGSGRAFVARLSEVVWECEEVWRNELPSDVIGRANAVRTACTELKSRIHSMAELALGEFDCRYTGLIHERGELFIPHTVNNPQSDRRDFDSGEFLTVVFADLELLSDVCKVLAENTVASPHNQPSKAHALTIARLVAEAWRHHFQEEPTANTKEESTPFTRLLKTLANRAAIDSPTPQLYPENGFVIGALIARKAIEKTKGV